MVIGLLILVVLRVKRVLLVIWHQKLLKDAERIKPLMRRYTHTCNLLTLSILSKCPITMILNEKLNHINKVALLKFDHCKSSNNLIMISFIIHTG